MELSQFDQKYVRVKTIYGDIHTGFTVYENEEFLECEFGGDEDGIRIEDFIIYNSQIESIEEITPHGTAELWTERLILRRCRMEDAEELYKYLGKDPSMYQYSGWNPYATPEMAEKTVRGFMEHYENEDEHFYSWVMDWESVVVGTIGAYDYKDGRIEVGYSVVKGWQGRGFATEALTKVLEYLTENEGIAVVTAWSAADNAGSNRVLEKAGMKIARREKDGLHVGGKTYDQLFWKYRKDSDMN